MPAGTANLIWGARAGRCALADSLIRLRLRVTVIEKLPMAVPWPGVPNRPHRRCHGRRSPPRRWGRRAVVPPAVQLRRFLVRTIPPSDRRGTPRTAHFDRRPRRRRFVAAVHGFGGSGHRTAAPLPDRALVAAMLRPALNCAARRGSRASLVTRRRRAEDSAGMVGTAPVVIFANQAGAFPSRRQCRPSPPLRIAGICGY